nr:MAG TPA: hypothetical protein [Caudoviricetes sp.]
MICETGATGIFLANISSLWLKYFSRNSDKLFTN